MPKRIALQKLYAENYAKFFSFAKGAVSDSATAEDLVQDMFVIALCRIDVLFASENPCGWLQNTLKNIIENFYQKHCPISADASELDSLCAEAYHSPVYMQYAGLIDDASLQLLIWIYCDEIGYAEVSRRLGASVDACKKRTQRAKQAMRDAVLKQRLL